jgi:hypothetical protein
MRLGDAELRFLGRPAVPDSDRRKPEKLVATRTSGAGIMNRMSGQRCRRSLQSTKGQLRGCVLALPRFRYLSQSRGVT